MTLSVQRVARMGVVRTFLPQDGEPVKSTAQLAHETGYTGEQIKQAVADLRDAQPHLPLIYDLIERGYGFTLAQGPVAKFYLWRMRTARTVVRRLLTGVLLPFWGMFLTEQQARRKRRIFEGLIAELEEDIEDAEVLATA